MEQLSCKTKDCPGELDIKTCSGVPRRGIDHLTVKCAKCGSEQQIVGQQAQTAYQMIKDKQKTVESPTEKAS